MDDHWSTTTGVVEQCLPGLRRFDPSPLLSEFQLGQKVDPCLLGLVPRHIIISLRATQYTKYKSSTYKVQTKEEYMIKNICSQVEHASALNEWFCSSIGESDIGSANNNKSSNGNRKGNNTSNHLGEFIKNSKKICITIVHRNRRVWGRIVTRQAHFTRSLKKGCKKLQKLLLQLGEFLSNYSWSQ